MILFCDLSPCLVSLLFENLSTINKNEVTNRRVRNKKNTTSSINGMGYPLFWIDQMTCQVKVTEMRKLQQQTTDHKNQLASYASILSPFQVLKCIYVTTHLAKTISIFYIFTHNYNPFLLFQSLTFHTPSSRLKISTYLSLHTTLAS